MTIMALTGAALMGLFLFACAHAPEAPLPAEQVTVPEAFTLYGETAPSPDRWWESFGSPELDALIGKALEGNPGLETSLARLEQARAMVVQAGADRYPDLTLNASASETRRSTDAGTETNRSRSLNLVSTYEVDFWDRVKARHRAALLELESSREELYTAALTLASEVTLKWLELISVRQQTVLVEDQLKTNRTVLDLIELRYLKGTATALDIYQQRQVVAETQAVLPGLQARRQTLLHELAVLTGQPPRSDMGLEETAFPELGDLPDTGIPADLLARRPDVRAAGLELRSARDRVRAARADRLPAVTLSATGGYSAQSLSDLIDNWMATLAANLVWPIFNAGARTAEVQRQEGLVRERLAVYRRAVLTAIREVEDALVRETTQVQYIQALEEQLSIARDSYREALGRYRKGLIDYLPALSALTSAQRFERSVVQARLERINQRVSLYRALGGDWMSGVFEER